MVKKLFKHEFLAWLRVLPIIYGITLVVAAVHRIVQFFESDSVYYEMVSSSAIFMYTVALLVTLATPTVFGVVRFYKNLFTGEGYLTMTLPVTPANHLWVKGLTAVAFEIMSVLVCLLSGMVITAGEVLTEVGKAAAYLLAQIPDDVGAHLFGYVAEWCLLMPIAMFGGFFMLYTCICMGQLFRKNRILAAVGVYFGFYIGSQILSTIAGISMVAIETAGVLEKLNTWIGDHPYATVHIGFFGAAVIDAGISAIYFLICHHVIRKKLNLE